LPHVTLLIGGFIIFMVIYLIAAPLLGAINSNDIANFKSMFSSIGFISKVFEVPLILMEKMCDLNVKKDSKQPIEN
jgi:hypothetical protein